MNEREVRRIVEDEVPSTFRLKEAYRTNDLRTRIRFVSKFRRSLELSVFTTMSGSALCRVDVRAKAGEESLVTNSREILGKENMPCTEKVAREFVGEEINRALTEASMILADWANKMDPDAVDDS